jgi:tetratricopeptide (TPR) repeat protein
MSAGLGLALALALPAVCALAAPREQPLEERTELLRSAAAAHPDDPAVTRALAAALLARGEAAQALAALDAHAGRDPGTRPSLAQLRGRALYAIGDVEGARSALEEAIAFREVDAIAHFYLGLTELRLGARASAAIHLARAEALDPTLAARVRAAARPRAMAGPLARFAFAGGAGFDYDTNSTLEGDEAITAIPGDRADGRLHYDAAVGVTLLRSERVDLSTGYRFEESRHHELDELDVRSHALMLGSTVALTPRSFARVEMGATLNHVDDRAHSHGASASTTIGWRSEAYGAFDVRMTTERRDYDDAPALPSLERDGWRLGVAVRHALRVDVGVPALLVTQLSYARTLTEGERDPFGLGAAFDAHLGALDTTLRWALPAKLRVDVRLGLATEHFDARNVVDFLSDDGVGDPNPERRRDAVIDASVTLVRPLTRSLDLQLRAGETRRFSNVDVYDWDRQIIGTQLRWRWPNH